VIVNFIADPWEWGSPQEWDSPPVMRKGDPDWIAAYREFKTRLHWLLLWHDEVQILDSFVLFNTQFEQWFLQTKRRPRGRIALEKVFREKALRIALRKDRTRKFTRLTEIDAAQVRGNREFRWFYGGSPTQDFVRELDTYLAEAWSQMAQAAGRNGFKPTRRSRPWACRSHSVS
jgi:hypothetical protein